MAPTPTLVEASGSTRQSGTSEIKETTNQNSGRIIAGCDILVSSKPLNESIVTKNRRKK
jgi:hypothetical protein